MKNILKRDRTGESEGDCKDRIREGEEERQAKINDDSFDSPSSFPNTPWAHSRNAPPGAFGGHV